MIQVKKTKSSGDSTNPAQPYQFSDASGKSGLPQAIGMAIMSIALYLRSMMSSPLAAQTTEPTREDSGSHQPHHAAKMGPASNYLSPMEQEQATKASTAASDMSTTDFALGFNFSHGGNVVPFVTPQERQPKLAVASAHQQSSEAPQPTVVSHSWDNPDFSNVSIGQSVFSSAATPSPTSEDAAPYELEDEPELIIEDEEETDKQTSNRAPVRQRSVYLSDLFGTGSLLIGSASLLEHTSDPDGETLVVEGLTVSSGTLEQTDDGYLYTPDPQYAGVVQFDYKISDGKAAIAQTAHLNIKPTGISGTDAKDTLSGDKSVDFIDAKDGDDTIWAKAGADLIYGGKGDDVIFGGEGNDEIFGGEGNDVLFGDAGDDRISGGADNDKVFGGSGSDILWGDEGQDELQGGSGSDLIYGGSGNDLILDGQDGDVVYGGAGSDTFRASMDLADDAYHGDDIGLPQEGVDVLVYSDATTSLSIDFEAGTVDGAETGHDSFDGIEVVVAGSGDDVFVSSVGEGHKVYSGGDGRDTLDLSRNTGALKIDLREGKVEDEDGDQDAFEDIEAFLGTDKDDLFVVSNKGHEISGGKGNDHYVFAQHADDYETAATINDFDVGDMIETRMFKFFERGEDNPDEGLQLGVGDLFDTLKMSRVNFSYETHDDGEYTRLEVHEQEEYGTVITLQGHHTIFLTDAH